MTVSGAEPNPDDPVVARFRRPDLALSAEHLADIASRETLEFLPLRIETHDGIAAEIGEPYRVLVVDVDRISHRRIARQPPLFPALRLRVVEADLAGIPQTYPEPVLRVGPHAPRTGPLGRRIHHFDGAGRDIDL